MAPETRTIIKNNPNLNPNYHEPSKIKHPALASFILTIILFLIMSSIALPILKTTNYETNTNEQAETT